MVNNVTLMGRLTTTPELKATNTGKSVTSFCLAVERNYVVKGKEREVDFIQIVAWDKTAEFVTANFHKGEMLALTGAIQTRKYEDKSGNEKIAFEILAKDVSFCGGKTSNAANVPYNEPNGEYAPVNTPQENEEELPF